MEGTKFWARSSFPTIFTIRRYLILATTIASPTVSRRIQTRPRQACF